MICFDLDGTLADSAEGIINSYKYVFSKMQCSEVPELGREVVGPALREVFSQYLPSSKIELGVTYFREYFSGKGIFEQTLYADIHQLLGSLSCSKVIVTSKPEVFANIVVRYFDIEKYFDSVHGAQLGGKYDSKTDLLQSLTGPRVMIGDRARDIEAAKAAGVQSIGVTYGYGSESEIISADPDCIAHNVTELSSLLSSCYNDSSPQDNEVK